MLTEECRLNPHLEPHGIEVIDTDLGEWIVQLRHEHPSHIVLPAIHITKEEVGELFHEQLGTAAGATDPDVPGRGGPPAAAQQVPGAEAGITGVNFAIAETGGFVVCTNEGNADLGVSLPKVHIACMGIEKLIPRAGRPGRLPAAAGPLGHRPADHDVLVALPRPAARRRAAHRAASTTAARELLGSNDFRRSLNCIRCGACINTCPVYRRSGGHSYGVTVAGPIGSILNAVYDPQAHKSLPFACSLCGSCTDVCPVKIDLHQQLFISRRHLALLGLIPKTKRLGLKLAAIVLNRPWLYALVGRITRFKLRVLPRWLLYNRLNPWGRQRELPAPPRQSFRELNRKRTPRNKK